MKQPMQDERRKLTIHGGPPGLSGQLAAALGPAFEIVEGQPCTGGGATETSESAILTVDQVTSDVSGASRASLSVLLDTVGEGVALVAATGDLIWGNELYRNCLLYTSPSPRDRTRSRMPSSA